nr:hypothetical protein CFP56_71340 [Quercus suber]
MYSVDDFRGLELGICVYVTNGRKYYEEKASALSGLLSVNGRSVDDSCLVLVLGRYPMLPYSWWCRA